MNTTQLITFTEGDWEKYFGTVPKAPPIPLAKVREIQKKIHGLLMLFYVPETVNEKPLTLNYLKKLIESPKKGDPIYFSHIKKIVSEAFGEKPCPKSHWILLSGIYIETTGKTHSEQQAAIKKLSQKTRWRYSLPPLLDASVCLAVSSIKEGKIPFYYYYTRCQEKVQKRHVVVGADTITSNSLRMNLNDYLWGPNGIALSIDEPARSTSGPCGRGEGAS